MGNPIPGAPVAISRTSKTVVIAAPTSTTKITGFFISQTGFNLTNEPLMARWRMSGSNRGRAWASFFGSRSVGSGPAGGTTFGSSVARTSTAAISEQPPLVHQEMLDDRAERECREKSERADDYDGAHQKAHEQNSVRRQRPGGHRYPLFRGQTASYGQHRNDDQEPAHQHGDSAGQVVPRRIAVDA